MLNNSITKNTSHHQYLQIKTLFKVFHNVLPTQGNKTIIVLIIQFVASKLSIASNNEILMQQMSDKEIIHWEMWAYQRFMIKWNLTGLLLDVSTIAFI